MKIVKGDKTIIVDYVQDGEVYARQFHGEDFVEAWRVDCAAFLAQLIEAVEAGALVLG